MDKLSTEKRSWNMSQIKGKDTKPEITVRKVLHSLGYRFRLHDSKLPGHPDIVLKKYTVVIFVHGCFWHRHNGCKYAYMPKSRIDFWEKKFQNNIKRDRIIEEDLKNLGWRQLVIWECQTKEKELLEKTLITFFEQCAREKTVNISDG